MNSVDRSRAPVGRIFITLDKRRPLLWRHTGPMPDITVVAFDADDTLWRSEDFFEEAQERYEAIVGRYVDLSDSTARQQLYGIETANLRVFGYGVKSMTLSMIEAAVLLTDGRIEGADVHRIVEIGKDMLVHPVILLDGVTEAVTSVAERYPVALITKGDLIHQESKVRTSGLSEIFSRIEIVSEKDPQTYRRVLKEIDANAGEFVMVGNSVRSDIAPVLEIGGWGIHIPYHLTWQHEEPTEPMPADHVSRMRTLPSMRELPAALDELALAAAEL